MKEVEKHANNDVSIIIIANKADRAATETPEVSEQDMEKFMQDTSLKIFTASAKTGTNVESCFLDLTSHLIDKYYIFLLNYQIDHNQRVYNLIPQEILDRTKSR